MEQRRIFPFNSPRQASLLDELKADTAASQAGHRRLDPDLTDTMAAVELAAQRLTLAAMHSELALLDAAALSDTSPNSFSSISPSVVVEGDDEDPEAVGRGLFLDASTLRTGAGELATLAESSACQLRHAAEFVAFKRELRLLRTAAPAGLFAARGRLAKWVGLASDSMSAAAADQFKNTVDEAQAMFRALRMWQFKAEQLCQRARQISPCQLRRPGAIAEAGLGATAVWCRCLGAYSARLADRPEEFETVFADEELQLLDNSDSWLWRARSLRGQDLLLPAPLLLLPPPCRPALDAAEELRRLLDAEFADCVRLLARATFWSLVVGVKDGYSNSERKFFACLSCQELDDFSDVRPRLERIFHSSWAAHPGFQLARERLASLELLLAEQRGLAVGRKSQFPESKFFLFADADVLKRLLALAERELASTTAQLPAEVGLLGPEDDGLWSSQPKSSATEPVEEDDEAAESRAEHSREQETRNSIAGVFNHAACAYVSLSDALSRGLISADRSCHVNNVSGERLTIIEAMNQGLIRAVPVASETSKAWGEQGGSGTEVGNQGGSGTNDGNQGGSGTEAGNQGGSGTNDGNQGGSGTNDGNQGGSGRNDGNQGGSGTEAGNQGGSAAPTVVSAKPLEDARNGEDIVSPPRSRLGRRDSRPFRVTHALEPATGAWLATEAAVGRGLLDPGRGVYRDGRRRLQLRDALQRGFVRAEFYGSEEGGEGDGFKEDAIDGDEQQQRRTSLVTSATGDRLERLRSSVRAARGLTRQATVS